MVPLPPQEESADPPPPPSAETTLRGGERGPESAPTASKEPLAEESVSDARLVGEAGGGGPSTVAWGIDTEEAMAVETEC